MFIWDKIIGSNILISEVTGSLKEPEQRNISFQNIRNKGLSDKISVDTPNGEYD